MPTYPALAVVDNQVTFEKPIEDIAAEVKPGGALKVLDPVEYHTSQQRKWYKGVCLKGLSDWNGDTVDEWDLRLKLLCNGNELLKKETICLGKGESATRLTIVGVGKRKMTQFIENILSLAIRENWPVTPPDEALRKQSKKD